AAAGRDRRHRRARGAEPRGQGPAAEAPDRRDQRGAPGKRRLRRGRQRPLPLVHRPVKPERQPKAAGIAAGHCDALFRQRTEEVDLLPEFGRLGERLARALAPALAAFGGGKAPDVRLAGAERRGAAELAGELDRLGANALLAAGAGKQRLLLAIDGKALLSQLDRAFGGTGEIGNKLPAALPLSADLLAQRVEQAVTEQLSQ